MHAICLGSLVKISNCPLLYVVLMRQGEMDVDNVSSIRIALQCNAFLRQNETWSAMSIKLQ